MKPSGGLSRETGAMITISLGPSFDPAKSDVLSVAKAVLRSLKEINAALPGYSDNMSRYHLIDVLREKN